MAIARVELPRVLAVERDHREKIAVDLRVADPAQPSHEVACGVDRRKPLVVEADHVGELRVSKNHRDRAALASHALRLIEMLIAVEVPLERASQHLLVADHPFDLRFLGEADHALPHRHLRWPHALGPAPEHSLEEPHTQLDLPLRILAVREVTLGELDLGVGAARRVDMADQRKDRVVVGREGQLRLTALRHLAVFRDDAADALELRLKEDRLVLVGEVTVLALQLGKAWVGFHPDRVAPREVEPDLEVADVLVRELGVRRPRRELEVSRRLLHSKRPRRLAHPAQRTVDDVAAHLIGVDIRDIDRLAPRVAAR